jgi:cell division protein FtsQ
LFRLNSPAKRLAFIIGIIAFVLIILQAINRKSDLNSGDLRVTILDYEQRRFVTKGDIQKIIQDTFNTGLSGIPVGSIDVKRVEEVLYNNGFIETADVYIDENSHVNVKITQREPVLRIIDMEGSSYYLDTKARYIPSSRHYTARVPVATGFINNRNYNTPVTDPANPLFSLYVLAQAIRADNFMNAQVEQIFVEKDGEFELVPKIGNHRILLGTTLDLPEKFKRLKIFYKETIPYEGWTKYKTVNIKYKGQIICGK